MTIGTPVQLGTAFAVIGASTATLTTGAASAAGNLIVVMAGNNGSATGKPLLVCSDSAGNTYTALTDFESAAFENVRAWYCPNALALGSGGTISITITGTGGNVYATAISIPNAAASTPLDVQGAGMMAVGTTPSIATGALAQADEIVIGFVYVRGGASDTFTQASGFTANNDSGTSAASRLRSAYQIVAATTTVTYAPVLGTSRSYVGDVLTFKGAAGSTYNVTQAEAGSAADTPSAQAIFASAVTETGAATDTVSAIGTFGVTVAESGAAVSLQSSTAILPSSVTEAGSAADTVTGGLAFTATVAEVGVAADTVSAKAVFGGTMAEAGVAADTLTTTATFGATVTETGAALDTPSAIGTFGVVVSEFSPLSDAASSTSVAGSGGDDFVVTHRRRRR